MTRSPAWRALACALALAALPADAAAQSLTSGGLRGRVVDERGVPVRDATVTLEGNGSSRVVTTDGRGGFEVVPLRSGMYRVLAEEVGYQPARVRGVEVVNGRLATVTVLILRQQGPVRPPTETSWGAGAWTGNDGTIRGRDELTLLDRDRSLVDVMRGFSATVLSSDGLRPTALEGVAANRSRLVVGGVERSMLHHPALPDVSARLTGPSLLSSALVTGFGSDAEWHGTTGAHVALGTRTPRGRVLAPFVAMMSSAIGSSLDNPGDSGATSLQAGVLAGGGFRGDSGGWSVRVEAQRLVRPAASPFVMPDVPVGGVDPVGVVRATAGRDISAWLAPVVRRTESVEADASVDLPVGVAGTVGLYGGVASWSEDAPVFGAALSNAAGATLEGSDVAARASLTTPGATWMNDARVGFSRARRTWNGAGVASAVIGDAGFAIGDPGGMAGSYREQLLEINDAVTIRSGGHALKLGGALIRRSLAHDVLDGSVPGFTFGRAEDFGDGRGLFRSVTGSSDPRSIGITEYAAFVQGTLRALPSLAVTVGVHVDKEMVPGDLVAANPSWLGLAGVNSALLPSTKPVVAPRASLAWDASGDGRTMIRGAGGLAAGRMDPWALSEVARFDGSVTVRATDGDVRWGTVPTGLESRPTLTMFGPGVRRPVSFKLDGSITQQLGKATVTVSGGYRHADYMLRVSDINRSPSSVATLADGRAVYGSLRQYGALITPATSSNRRFDEFDAVHVLTSTGYVDHQFATIALRRAVGSLVLSGEYTWSRTEDNLPGQRHGGRSDRLSPIDDAWDGAPSDFDVPHRIVASAAYRPGGARGLELGARLRHQSGLPFTPGFTAGVDINGDGSGSNDPAALVTNIPGLPALMDGHSCLQGQSGGIASRNSCRDEATTALDLHAGAGVRVGGRRLVIALDAFNVIATATGLYDHAAVRVDPLGTIGTDATGRLVLPLVANPRFGTLLSRRTDARVLRIGLRLEN